MREALLRMTATATTAGMSMGFISVARAPKSTMNRGRSDSSMAVRNASDGAQYGKNGSRSQNSVTWQAARSNVAPTAAGRERVTRSP